MITDSGAPLSVVGKPWVDKYLEENDMTRDELEKETVEEYFRFGPSEVYRSKYKLEIPIIVRDKKGRKVRIVVKPYEIDTDVPMLCGKNTLKEWGSITIHNDDILKCTAMIDNEEVEFDLEQTKSGHDALKLEVLKEASTEETVSFISSM